jgi:tetratricopeptide (TPR) repeat protein
MNIKYFRKILLLLIIPLLSSAQDGDGQAGTRSPFADYGFGARAMGMGDAFVAKADDPTAVFWNPAGLDFIYQQSVTLFHASLYAETMYDFLGYVYPTLDLGTFGIGISRIGTSDILRTDITNFDFEGSTFAFETYRAYLSYGLRIPWDLAVGASLKVERSAFTDIVEYGDAIGVGVGFDLAVIYRPQFSTSPWLRDWSLGLNIQNLFSPQLKHGETPDALPMTLKAGLMRTIRFAGGGDAINVLLDFDASSQTDLGIHFGSEYSFRQLGTVRLGYNGGSVAFGAGVEYDMFQIDYAFGNSSTDGLLDPTHRISLTVNFGMNRDEMYEIVEELRRIEEERIISEIREADKQRYVTEHLQQADDFFKNDQHLDAIGEYQNVISVDPFNQQANVMLDSAKSRLDQVIAAQRESAIQLAVDKERTEADLRFIDDHYNRGRLLLDQKQYTEALIEFNIAQERAPDNQIVSDAIQTSQRLMRADLNALIQRARREFQNQNYSEALRLLSEARLLSSDDRQVKKEVDTLVERVKLQENIQKGLMLYDIGNYEDALSIFESVLTRDPTNQFIQQYYTRSKIEALAETERMDPQSERKYLEGVDKFLLGKYSDAIGIWEEILTKHPYSKKVLEAIEGARERLKRSQSE